MRPSEVGTLVLDEELRIRQLELPPALGIALRSNDEGRLISEVQGRLGCDELERDARWVLEKGGAVERTLRRDEGDCRLRVAPLRTETESGPGVEVAIAPLDDPGAPGNAGRRRTPDAHRIDLMDAIRPLSDPAEIQREAARVLGERLDVDRILRESEARLDAFLEQLPVGAGMIDEEGYWVFKNPVLDQYVFEKLPSATSSEHSRWRCWNEDGSLVEPEQWPGARALRGETVSPGMDFLYTDSQGNERWTRVSATPFRGPENRVKGAIVVVQDIHERKQAERVLGELNETLEERVQARTEELRQREEEFRALIAASASIVWRANPDGTFVEDSRSWCDVTGKSIREWGDRGWIGAVHPEDRERVREQWKGTVKAGSSYEDEFRLYHADSDTHRWIRARAVPLHDGSGDVRGWIGMNIDVDRRKRTQDQLETLARELEERVDKRTQQVRELSSKLTMAEQRERHRIAQILHDDLQQRLYGVQLRLVALKTHIESGDLGVLLEHVDTVESWVEESITTTRQLSIDLSPPVLEDEGIVEALRWLQGHMEDLYGLEVDLRADRREVPVHDEPVRVLLFQVVRELLFNVVKHADVQQATVTLRVENGDLVIVVADEGAGFDPGVLEATEGAGFGLTSVCERILFFEGELAVDAAPGEGTRITVRTPLHRTRAGPQ